MLKQGDKERQEERKKERNCCVRIKKERDKREGKNKVNLIKRK